MRRAPYRSAFPISWLPARRRNAQSSPTANQKMRSSGLSSSVGNHVSVSALFSHLADKSPESTTGGRWRSGAEEHPRQRPTMGPACVEVFRSCAFAGLPGVKRVPNSPPYSQNPHSSRITAPDFFMKTHRPGCPTSKPSSCSNRRNDIFENRSGGRELARGGIPMSLGSMKGRWVFRY